MIYEEIFREFEKAKIRYLFVGGVAINLYGYVRLTDDGFKYYGGSFR